MSDSSSNRRESSTDARMVIEPDALHEGEDELFLDCLQCGSTTTITQILNKGRCSGYLDSEVAESKTDDKQLLNSDLHREAVARTHLEVLIPVVPLRHCLIEQPPRDDGRRTYSRSCPVPVRVPHY